MWNAIRDEARQSVLKDAPAAIRGSDVRRDALELAKMNARSAGVGNVIAFDRLDVKDARPPAGNPGVLICNPPYGERIGDEKEWVPLYRALGEVFGTHWAGWRAFVFTSNDWLARKIDRKVKSSVHFYNGKLPCKLWEFDTTR